MLSAIWPALWENKEIRSSEKSSKADLHLASFILPVLILPVLILFVFIGLFKGDEKTIRLKPHTLFKNILAMIICINR